MVSITEKTCRIYSSPQFADDFLDLQYRNRKKKPCALFRSDETLTAALVQTSEYLSSFQNNNAIPNHGFENISAELKFLAIEDSFLETNAFKKDRDDF
jgi:DNA mismatch repair protein MutS2